MKGQLYIHGKLNKKDQGRAFKVVDAYSEYTNRISRAERLAKALTKRRELIIPRLAKQYRKGSTVLKYIGTLFYWTTNIKKSTIEILLRAPKGAHESFVDRMYRVYQVKCKGCSEPILINSRTEYLSRYSRDQCAKCRDAQYKASSERLRIEYSDRSDAIQKLKTMPYKEYLQTPHWQALRLSMLKRAAYKCSLCGESKPLHVHHNTYVRRGEEKLSDLIVLCHECHESFHEVARES